MQIRKEKINMSCVDTSFAVNYKELNSVSFAKLRGHYSPERCKCKMESSFLFNTFVHPIV